MRSFSAVLFAAAAVIIITACGQFPGAPGAPAPELPQFDKATGTYKSAITVSLSCKTSGADIYYATANFTALDDYKKYSSPVTIDKHTTLVSYAQIGESERTTLVRADYAIVADQSGSIIGNGDFSLGETLWLLWADSDQNAAAVVNYSGKTAAVEIAKPGDNPWNIGLHYAPRVEYEKGKIYSINFSAKASKNRSIVFKAGELNNDLNGDGNPHTDYLWKELPLTTAFKTFEFEFLMNNPDDDKGLFGFYLGKENGDIEIDNISITERSPRAIDPDKITDVNLKNALEAEAQKKGKTLNELDETSLKELVLFNARVSDLAGIDQFTHLELLKIGYNSIGSLTPILGLKYLRDLDIANNPMNYSDLSGISIVNFPELTALFLGDREDTDLDNYRTELIDRMLSFPLLNSFGFENFQMNDTDFQEIYNRIISKRKLCGIDMDFNNITNTSLNLIAEAESLNWLQIKGTNIDNLSVLETLPDADEFRSIDLENTTVADLTPLKNLYDAGAFRDNGEIRCENCSLDLRPGDPNRAIVDYLISKGVTVHYEEGNNIEVEAEP